MSEVIERSSSETETHEFIIGTMPFFSWGTWDKGFPLSSASKESACNAGELGLISELGKSPGGGHGNPLGSFLPGESHGQRSLTGYSPWGHKSWTRLNHYIPPPPGIRLFNVSEPQFFICKMWDKDDDGYLSLRIPLKITRGVFK